MKLETERLYIVPCTEERIQVANEQGYNSGPHIVGHVKNVKKDATFIYIVFFFQVLTCFILTSSI